MVPEYTKIFLLMADFSEAAASMIADASLRVSVAMLIRACAQRVNASVERERGPNFWQPSVEELQAALSRSKASYQREKQRETQNPCGLAMANAKLVAENRLLKRKLRAYDGVEERKQRVKKEVRF